jgi:hypothetical protein
MAHAALTPVDDIVVVEVIHSVEHLPNCLSSILLRELALVADAVEQLAAGCQLGYNVVFVLPCSARDKGEHMQLHPPSTRTSHGT